MVSSMDAGPTPKVAAFPIVGVGASAGGLAATTELLQALGATPGIAVVIVHHLAPNHPSKLAEILAKATPMPVAVASEGARIEVDHIYVIPHAADVTVAGGLLHLTPRDEQRGLHLPVDRLFESLAEDQDSSAVGVVLSGTGFDGTAGVRAIHAAGGITFAQDITAQHPDMPRNAVATGCVGFVLAPGAMARELTRLGERLVTPPAQRERDLAIITDLLHEASGTDFSCYKPATLLRRIERRSFLSHRASLPDYVELLRHSPAELQHLCEDVLLHVTDFFRDPAVFAALAQVVFPRLLERRPPDLPIRVWVPACSSGEEVYSLAIALDEAVRAAGADVTLKLFGTDMSASALEKARAARYPASIERDLSPERLQRYFARVDGGYQLGRAVRDICVFSRHDVIRDPPFSHIDLISCRNLMLDLDMPTQERVMPLFHYALREPGFLVLGRSEATQNLAGFDAFDPQLRIFARSSVAPRMSLHFGARPHVGHAPAPGSAAPAGGPSELQREVDRLLLGRFAPPGVVVTEDLAVVHFRGQTGAFIEPSPGAATLDLMHLAREELRLSLREAIDAARLRGAPATVRCLVNGGRRAVTIEVLPLVSSVAPQRHFIVLFVAEPPVSTPTPPQAGDAPQTDELESTRRHLESALEQLEASHAELTAANEALVASKQELRRLEEELQTAREDLSTTNEELRTVNDELNARNRSDPARTADPVDPT